MAQQSYRVFYPIRYQGTLYGPRDGFDADDADPEIIAFAEYGEIALIGPAPEPPAQPEPGEPAQPGPEEPGPGPEEPRPDPHARDTLRDHAAAGHVPSRQPPAAGPMTTQNAPTRPPVRPR
jgi:hypothetical protein